MREIIDKAGRRLRGGLIRYLRTKSFYAKTYSSYWHSRIPRAKTKGDHVNYLTAVPNRGAGIGHQMANWIAGHYFACWFGLHFAHSPFSNAMWEEFLGFGESEKNAEVLTLEGYKRVRLPLFDEDNLKEVSLISEIIESYRHCRVVFVAEQDQFYRRQFDKMDILKQKFHTAPARVNDSLAYKNGEFNVAIHVRRGDIVTDPKERNDNLAMRWQDNVYFKRVLASICENLSVSDPVAIYLFSQGKREDFPEFEEFSNLHFCLEMDARSTFLHMVNSDLLISSKSSFSYKPALLSYGIKVCPKNFWHGYPQSDDWILVNEDGSFDVTRLTSCCAKRILPSRSTSLIHSTLLVCAFMVFSISRGLCTGFF